MAAMFLLRNPRNQCEEHAKHDCSTCWICEIKNKKKHQRNLCPTPRERQLVRQLITPITPIISIKLIIYIIYLIYKKDRAFALPLT